MNHSFSLEGSVALVTGAASGICAATAVRLASEGATVAIVDVNGEGAARTAEQVAATGAQGEVFITDLSELDQLPGLVEAVVDRFGRVDILVNGAAITGNPIESLLDVTGTVFDAVHTVNLKAPLVLLQCCAREMIRQDQGGKIVNITSSGAFRGRSLPSYSTAKAALGQLTRVAANELGKYSINVNSVAPGLTRTNLGKGVDIDGLLKVIPHANQLLERVSEPEDVAGVIAFLCSEAARQITGQTIHTSAGAIL